MIRLKPKKGIFNKATYIDVDKANFLIYNDLPLNYKHGTRQKNNSGSASKTVR
jgi:hypothetical protein